MFLDAFKFATGNCILCPFLHQVFNYFEYSLLNNVVGNVVLDLCSKKIATRFVFVLMKSRTRIAKNFSFVFTFK